MGVLFSYDSDKIEESKKTVDLDQLVKDLGAEKVRQRKSALKTALALSIENKIKLYKKLSVSDDPELKLISRRFAFSSYIVSGAKYSSLDGLGTGSKEGQETQKKAVDKGLALEIEFKDVGIILRLIPAGTFTMGSPKDEKDRFDSEVQHEVTLSESYWMGKYEVTQSQWKAIMGNNPSVFKGDDLPVESVSWNDCQKFIAALNKKYADKLPKGYEFSLPTEAQWEYACRAGTTTATHYGNSFSSTQANFNGAYPYGGASKARYLDKTSNVGSYKANAWGLYDMHGNVYEWCSDWYGSYGANAVVDPKGAKTGASRVYRGGGWYNGGRLCRSAIRNYYSPSYGSGLGLRLVLSPVQELK